METAILVHLWVPFRSLGMDKKEQARIYRKLYGYRSSSNYGKHHYSIKGLLGTIPSVRYEDGNFLIREEDLPIIKKFIEENKTGFRFWRVIPDESDREKLKLHSA